MADTQILEPVLLAALAKQGIVAGNVALRRDYAPRSRGKGYSPYARTYRDARTDKQFTVISGIAGCDAFGQAHELAWRDKDGIIENGNNIFHAVVDKGAVRLVTLSDQPSGAKKDDEVTYRPQLFIGGAEVQPLSDTPRLLEIDPDNENYHNNVLEWDYGVCRRRVRLIEGRFLGSWVFLSNPEGDVLIKYNQSGKLMLRLLYAKDNDTEYIPKEYFEAQKEWPIVISDSLTFYPDTDPETSSVDGNVYRSTTDESWATIVAGAGTNAGDSGNNAYLRYTAGTTTDLWNRIYRFIALFDTSSLPDTAIISAAVLSLHGQASKSDGCSASPSVNVYSSNPASNTAVIPADYSTLGTTPFCDTAIAYADWVEGSTANAYYNGFALNASGIAAISKAGVSKFGARLSHDATGTPPNWVSAATTVLYLYTSERGAGYQPRLVVTYITGITEKSAAETGAGAEAKTSGHPIVITNGTETGSGLESLGSRDLGKNESGSGLDIASLLAAISPYEAGSGAEAALNIVVLSGDAGLSSELSWMLKDVLSSDGGNGADALKYLIKTVGSGSEMRLYERLGQEKMPTRQEKMPTRQERMPSKGVNL